MSREKPRQIAARILLEHQQHSAFAESLLDRHLTQSRLDPKDRALTQELVCGVIRWQATLDWLIARKTASRTQNRTIQTLLRLALYQLFWLDRIPDHAAVHQTVELTKTFGFAPKAGFVNAFLRNYVRERQPTRTALQELKTAQPHLGYSHPDWLCQRWRNRWNDHTLTQLLNWNNTPAPTFARLNTLRCNADTLTAQWHHEQVQFTPRHWPWITHTQMFQLLSHPPLPQLPSFQQGLFYIQDPSTLLAVHLLNPQPGKTILDLCAAPGGKTTFIAQILNNQGSLFAHEPNPQRRALLTQNCQRLGARCTTIPHSPSLDPNLLFDQILIDAPCSNTGVLRRRLDLRWRLKPEEINRLAAKQLHLLETAAKQLRTGGSLLYSTCSLEPEENQQTVQQFLDRHPAFHCQTEQTLLPFADDVDGAYVARLTCP